MFADIFEFDFIIIQPFDASRSMVAFDFLVKAFGGRLTLGKRNVSIISGGNISKTTVVVQGIFKTKAMILKCFGDSTLRVFKMFSIVEPLVGIGKFSQHHIALAIISA